MPAGKPPLRIRGGVKMIDNPRTVARLIEQLQDHLPIPAFPTKEIVRTLRRGGMKASVDRALTIKRVFYAGDEAGLFATSRQARAPKRSLSSL
jgi:hypothetical protein